MRLRRSHPDAPGIRRLRAGRGFRYVAPDGVTISGEDRARLEALVIPPAWKDVWICPWPNGHIQAIGTDAAGRRQYLYHEEWRRQRDGIKHDRVLELARVLPGCRKVVAADLQAEGLTRERVLAAAFRLLDLGAFRIGSESYADTNDTYGLATLRREHLRVSGRTNWFCYPAKGGQERKQRIVDARLAQVLGELLARPTSAEELLAWQESDGRWHDVHSADVNDFVRTVTRGDFTAKDFRTWNATVLMAQLLAAGPRPGSVRGRKRAVLEGYQGVAEYLGNTVAVARSAYVDPRVVELYADGVALPQRVLPRSRLDVPVHGRVERAVYRMLHSPTARAA